MTRKEIEERCREEMQQSIPDKNALWEKIEQRLPEQRTVVQEKQKISHKVLYRTMAAAACFLFVVSGVILLRTRLVPVKNDSIYMTQDAVSNEAPAGKENYGAPVRKENYEAPAEEECNEAAEGAADEEYDASMKEFTANGNASLTYADLSVPDGGEPQVQTDQLSADGYFTQEEVLRQAELFVDVQVTDAQQLASGEISYTLSVISVYAGTETSIGDSITIVNRSPYLLKTGHEYVLPIYDESGWQLAGDCAPQMELTLDGKVLYHSGWISLMSESAVPVTCERRSKDDFFYDRMYLTGQAELVSFLQDWENSRI